MPYSSIEPLDSRIAPATILTSAVFTSESTIISGNYDGGVDAVVEIFATPIGGPAASLGTVNYVAANGTQFSAFAPALAQGTKISAVVTPNGGIPDAQSNPIGSTRGLWVENLEIAEGNISKVVNFTVRLSLPSAQTVTVLYSTSAINATPGIDYSPTSGMLTFAPGETTKTVPVTILGDTSDEEIEGFSFDIGASAGAIVADESATCKILDDDASSAAAVGVYLVPVTASESDATATVEVRLTKAAGASLDVQLGTLDGSGSAGATSGADYTSTSTTLTFAPGETLKTFTVPLTHDATFEGRERFFARITGTTAGVEVLTQESDIVILDNDAPAATVSIADVTVVEGTSTTVNTLLQFTVSLTAPATEQVVLRLSSGEGTARLSDFQGGTGTLTIDIGETSGTIDIGVRPDNFLEGAESFFMALDEIRGAVGGDTFAVGTITNDDAGLPVLEVTDVTVRETNAVQTAVFEVTLSVAAAAAVTVDVATGLGSALGGIDYLPASGQLRFLPGETSKLINISIAGDTAYESTENFGLSLSGASNNASIADNVGVGTILDDDPVNTSTPRLAILDRQVLEGTGANRTSTVVILLDHAAPAPVTVQLRYRDGQAVLGKDFGNQALTVNIAAGSDSGTSEFTIGSDFALEPNENFFVDVLSATGALVTDGNARITILNDDEGPEISENQKTARWRDVDGDFITLTASKGILTTANFAMYPQGSGLLLGALFLDDPAASGVSISITAKGTGNKSIAMGGIIATGVDLGTIKVAGDISRIKAGSATSALAIAKLDVASIGTQDINNDLERSQFSEITGRIGSVNVRGNFENALISVNSGTAQSIGSLKIAGHFKGGSSGGAGYIFASGDIGAIDIKGGMIGGAGFSSGTIQTLGKIGKVNIGGDIAGSSGNRSGAIFAYGLHTPNTPGIASLTIKGSLRGGSGGLSGTIYSFGPIPALSLGGISSGFIAAGGIAKLAVANDVTGTQIITGFAITSSVQDTGFQNPTTSVDPIPRPTAGIGKVTVGGNWIASSMSADVYHGGDGFYGDSNDRLGFASTVAAIQSVVIKGIVVGTAGTGDSFGFVAKTIGSFRALNATPTLTANGVDVLGIGTSGDVSLREITL